MGGNGWLLQTCLFAQDATPFFASPFPSLSLLASGEGSLCLQQRNLEGASQALPALAEQDCNSVNKKINNILKTKKSCVVVFFKTH